MTAYESDKYTCTLVKHGLLLVESTDAEKTLFSYMDFNYRLIMILKPAPMSDVNAY